MYFLGFSFSALFSTPRTAAQVYSASQQEFADYGQKAAQEPAGLFEWFTDATGLF